jgi:hypothetical protein
MKGDGDESDHGTDEVGDNVVLGVRLSESSSVAPLPLIGMVMNDSACHSYQTFRSLVTRHIDTCSSELPGR